MYSGVATVLVLVSLVTGITLVQTASSVDRIQRLENDAKRAYLLSRIDAQLTELENANREDQLTKLEKIEKESERLTEWENGERASARLPKVIEIDESLIGYRSIADKSNTCCFFALTLYQQLIHLWKIANGMPSDFKLIINGAPGTLEQLKMFFNMLCTIEQAAKDAIFGDFPDKDKGPISAAFTYTTLVCPRKTRGFQDEIAANKDNQEFKLSDVLNEDQEVILDTKIAAARAKLRLKNVRD